MIEFSELSQRIWNIKYRWPDGGVVRDATIQGRCCRKWKSNAARSSVKRTSLPNETKLALYFLR